MLHESADLEQTPARDSPGAAAPACTARTCTRPIMHKSAFPGLLAWLAAIAVHAGVVWLVAPPL
jgi:hypothetical protein